MKKIGMHAEVKKDKADESKKELTKLRKENKQLTEENRTLREQVEQLTEENKLLEVAGEDKQKE